MSSYTTRVPNISIRIFSGSFGDFLAGLISYSIEEYYDCHSSKI